MNQRAGTWTPAVMRAWRGYMGYTKEQASEALGYARRACYDWENAKRRIPLVVELACTTLAARGPRFHAGLGVPTATGDLSVLLNPPFVGATPVEPPPSPTPAEPTPAERDRARLTLAQKLAAIVEQIAPTNLAWEELPAKEQEMFKADVSRLLEQQDVVLAAMVSGSPANIPDPGD